MLKGCVKGVCTCACERERQRERESTLGRERGAEKGKLQAEEPAWRRHESMKLFTGPLPSTGHSLFENRKCVSVHYLNPRT